MQNDKNKASDMLSVEVSVWCFAILSDCVLV